MSSTVYSCFVAALLAAPGLAAQSIPRTETGFLDRAIPFGADSIRYQVYLPPGFKPNGSWPVILYLHGEGVMGVDGTRQTQGGIAAAIRANRASFPAVIVLPQAQKHWVVPQMEAIALQALDSAMTEFRGDRDRVYLIGYSGGGAGAYRLAYLYPDRFAALIVIAGSVRSAEQLLTEDELRQDRETHAYVKATDPFTALAKRLRALPITITHGGADELIPVEESRRLTKALQAAHGTVRYMEYPLINHTDVIARTLAEPTLMTWLFDQQRREKAQR